MQSVTETETEDDDETEYGDEETGRNIVGNAHAVAGATSVAQPQARAQAEGHLCAGTSTSDGGLHANRTLGAVSLAQPQTRSDPECQPQAHAQTQTQLPPSTQATAEPEEEDPEVLLLLSRLRDL